VAARPVPRPPEGAGQADPRRIGLISRGGKRAADRRRAGDGALVPPSGPGGEGLAASLGSQPAACAEALSSPAAATPSGEPEARPLAGRGGGSAAGSRAAPTPPASPMPGAWGQPAAAGRGPGAPSGRRGRIGTPPRRRAPGRSGRRAEAAREGRTAVAPATAHWYPRRAPAGRAYPPASARIRPRARRRFPRQPRLLGAASRRLRRSLGGAVAARPVPGPPRRPGPPDAGRIGPTCRGGKRGPDRRRAGDGALVPPPGPGGEGLPASLRAALAASAQARSSPAAATPSGEPQAPPLASRGGSSAAGSGTAPTPRLARCPARRVKLPRRQERPDRRRAGDGGPPLPPSSQAAGSGGRFGPGGPKRRGDSSYRLSAGRWAAFPFFDGLDSGPRFFSSVGFERKRQRTAALQNRRRRGAGPVGQAGARGPGAALPVPRRRFGSPSRYQLS